MWTFANNCWKILQIFVLGVELLLLEMENASTFTGFIPDKPRNLLSNKGGVTKRSCYVFSRISKNILNIEIVPDVRCER